ncbi:MAG: hypothetical protein KJ970_16935 [Candidatus Eisenbacteria bacterium]|uniref:Uncharacterized protein n=1 Tax=Eiseniibacteriota bacterium TaxID=2212470 RepID=A0A948W4U3_UNCEI|nr:hypothetical protein [Candidatus Eisenbacteria bacterium]MBU1950184.1 hypothetical protein [Candidatus Eisenbacteria bacterium]MBU2692602.1 hypothetical protein [Candidatus Eisenbacteria bacterium]
MGTLQVGFETLLRGFDPEILKQDSCVAYGLWPDLSLCYVNRGWKEFASKNGGDSDISSRWRLGSRVLDAVSDELKIFYQNVYSQCFSYSKPWSHEYECSSPELFRRFEQTFFPLKMNEGLLVVNRLLTETLHDPAEHIATSPDEEWYRNEAGILRQCSNCRRTQNIGSLDRWDWVPEWVRQPADATRFVLCPSCLDSDYAHP